MTSLGICHLLNACGSWKHFIQAASKRVYKNHIHISSNVKGLGLKCIRTVKDKKRNSQDSPLAPATYPFYTDSVGQAKSCLRLEHGKKIGSRKDIIHDIHELRSLQGGSMLQHARNLSELKSFQTLENPILQKDLALADQVDQKDSNSTSSWLDCAIWPSTYHSR